MKRAWLTTTIENQLRWSKQWYGTKFS